MPWSLGCIVLPMDLILGALATGKLSGFFGGSRLGNERVFIVSSLRDGEKDIFTDYVERLKGHRTMNQTHGGYQQELLKWIVVKAGFHKWFEGNFQRSASEFTEWSGVPAEELEEKPNYFCCLEPAEKGPLVTGLAAVPNQGLVETSSLIATVLQEKATPLLRLPELVVQSLSGKKVVVIG